MLKFISLLIIKLLVKLLLLERWRVVILFGLMNAWLELGSMLKVALCFVLGLVALSLGGAFLLVLLGFAPGQVAL